MKGLEPIVSAVMMLMIAIAAGAVVSGWVSTFSSEKAKNIRNYTQDQLSCNFAGLYIKNATYNCSNSCAAGVQHTTVVTVVNSGKKQIAIDSIVLQNATGSVYNLRINATQNINIGETVTIMNVSMGSCSGINKTIDKVIISSINCPASASDSLSGGSVAYIECG
ncbi:MAG TPA: hypothetical protein VI968_02110 [archaeon]|nr:hypothetical protein [archaeon]